MALELLYSARTGADYERLQRAVEALPWCPTTQAAMARALEVRRALARQGKHRRALPGLVIAATAERHGAAVLHYDRDLDMIFEITKQATEWIAPPGSAGQPS